jgi:16S rRNA (cytosine967-C5)-methyltransferase
MNPTPFLQSRAVAARAVRRVVGDGESLSGALSGELSRASPNEHALVKELCFGTLRWHERLGALRDQLVHKPLKRKDLDVACLLEIGLYQLVYLRIPAHASLHETVEATAALGKPWAKGLVNAVMRNFERDGSQLLESLDRSPEIRLSHPQWLIARLKQAYPAHWSRVCAAANQHPPMTLRVNSHHTTRDKYLYELQLAGIAAKAHSLVATAISLDRPLDVYTLPGFAQGLISVQDAAAQMAAPILSCRPGMRVLDACAAPGGKAAHILESTGGDLDLTLVEMEERRAELVRATLARGGWRAKLCVADAARPQDWWDGRPFERILVDAPCSGTGVIRRHPDIKVLRRPQDIGSLQGRQRELLHALWPLLAPKGMLLYVTCSVLKEENVQVAGVVASECDATLCDERQILPGDDDMDGFYYARLAKR